MTKEGHAACLFFLIILIIGNISLAIENNESRIFSISKKEFLNVLQGIIFSSNFENINESTTLNKNENTGNIDSKTVKKPKVMLTKSLSRIYFGKASALILRKHLFFGNENRTDSSFVGMTVRILYGLFRL